MTNFGILANSVNTDQSASNMMSPHCLLLKPDQMTHSTQFWSGLAAEEITHISLWDISK